MEPSKHQQVVPPQYGFNSSAPPAYDQHQNFPQQHQQNIQPVPQVFQVQPHQLPPQGAQVVTVIASHPMGPDPVGMQCPSCHSLIQTRIDYETSTKTHLFAGLICLLCWPCAWIPYVTDSCKNVNHYCPSCGTYLGRYTG